jgi:sigma-B regulation protein RsbU (phosphoserine phosphatase)
MERAGTPQVLLCSDQPAGADDLEPPLERAGYRVRRLALTASLADLAPPDLVILDGTRRDREARNRCSQLRARPATGTVPVLLITGDHSPAGRLAALEAGADTYLLRPFLPAEFLHQVEALLRVNALHIDLAEKGVEVRRAHQQLQQHFQQLDHDLEMARRIQQNGLPRVLPDVPRTRFGVYHRPCGRPGGDCFEILRVDETHIALYLADAMSHGLSAALLPLFLKQTLQPKVISGSQYGLVAPDVVLQRLNRELMDLSLSDRPFVSMVYLLYNYQDATLRFARAGHPPPLCVPVDGEPQLWHLPGNFMGVFATDFAVRSQRLQPGDKVVLMTDGLERSAPDESPQAADHLLGPAARHHKLPIEEFIARLAHDLSSQTSLQEDFTLLGLECTGEA